MIHLKIENNRIAIGLKGMQFSCNKKYTRTKLYIIINCDKDFPS